MFKPIDRAGMRACYWSYDVWAGASVESVKNAGQAAGQQINATDEYFSAVSFAHKWPFQKVPG